MSQYRKLQSKSSMPSVDVENVSSVAHCATRLRVMVKDEAKINKDVD